MEKKGQASMEFLMTYGWAILAAVLAIGVLAYYGVFSPSKSLPDICTLSAPFGCDEYQVNATGVTIILQNGGGDTVMLNNFSIEGCGHDDSSYTNISDGSSQTIFMACSQTTGTKFSGKITIDYLRSGKTISQTATGDVRAEVV